MRLITDLYMLVLAPIILALFPMADILVIWNSKVCYLMNLLTKLIYNACCDFSLQLTIVKFKVVA